MAKNKRDTELERLRVMVRKRRSDATAKANRIRRNTGVDIRGTDLDPRRPVNAVDRYNRRQLEYYLSELNEFNSRSVGYVAGANNAPIPKQEWQRYKKLERQYNSIGRMKFDEIADVFIPLSGMTVAEREKLMVPTGKRAQGEIIHRPYSEIDRKAAHIKDIDALRKLERQLTKRLKEKYLPSQLDAARNQLKQMLVGIGNGDLFNEVDRLSDSQFNVLWNYTGFATAVSAITPSGGHRSKAVREADRSDLQNSAVVEGYERDIREYFGWARSLELPEKGTKRSSQGSRSRAKKKPRGRR